MGREVDVPASELSGAAFSLDHLLVDADAVPTLVEVKRASDTRARREVVAQMLDYAANGSRYWPAQLLRQCFEDTCRRDGASPEEIFQGALGGQAPDAFWENVRDNLLAGRLRLLFVADQIPVELRAIVEFLNKQMTPAEVLAVDLRRHRSDTGLEVLAPTVYGDAAVTAKGPSASGRRPWTSADVEQAAQQASPRVHAIVTALLKHAEGAGARLVSGTGAYPSVIAHYPIIVSEKGGRRSWRRPWARIAERVVPSREGLKDVWSRKQGDRVRGLRFYARNTSKKKPRDPSPVPAPAPKVLEFLDKAYKGLKDWSDVKDLLNSQWPSSNPWAPGNGGSIFPVPPVWGLS